MPRLVFCLRGKSNMDGGTHKLTRPSNGAWDLKDKHFFKPGTIRQRVVAVYDRRFDNRSIEDLIRHIVQGCRTFGMPVLNRQPIIETNLAGHGDVSAQLRMAGLRNRNMNGETPNLIVVVLPDGGDDIYRRVKYFGDVEVNGRRYPMCQKAGRAREQYWTNVLAKVNVKPGGINHVLSSEPLLRDPRNPVVVLGADVMHLAPGTVGRPSYAGVVGSVDPLASKYVPTMRVQKARMELIDDMVKDVINLHCSYKKGIEKKNSPPGRLYFYRDGVSIGQYQQVVEKEYPLIRELCKDLGINPKFTLIIAGKRHHFRSVVTRLCCIMLRRFMAPKNDKGHTPADLVVDTEITDPICQSHKPLLGTSRPAHYIVVHERKRPHFGSITKLLQCSVLHLRALE
ncbi:hypothetical protein AX15_002839 [Amanita polypyramis BW_CC]|nr:hypothetical protein AX15_002839 [Amanita polypyramis BW_CC]